MSFSGVVSDDDTLPSMYGSFDKMQSEMLHAQGLHVSEDVGKGLQTHALETQTQSTIMADPLGGFSSDQKSNLENQSAVVTQLAKGLENVLNSVVHAVYQAVILGHQGTCPQCQHTEIPQDETWLHMTCSACACRWCYGCGKERTGFQDCCITCDKLGSQSILDVSSADGWAWKIAVCHDWSDFHRRKALYFLQKVKQCVPRLVWDCLSRQSGCILSKGVGSESLRWDEINQEAKPMLYGCTKLWNIQWTHDMNDTISQLKATMMKSRRSSVDEAASASKLVFPSGDSARKLAPNTTPSLRAASAPMDARQCDGNFDVDKCILCMDEEALAKSPGSAKSGLCVALFVSLVLGILKVALIPKGSVPSSIWNRKMGRR